MVPTPEGERPLVDSDIQLAELTTKTKVHNEQDDEGMHVVQLAAGTHTAVNMEQDDAPPPPCSAHCDVHGSRSRGRRPPLILLITNSEDITSDFVVLELRRRGIRFHRFNTDHADNLAPTFRLDESGPSWTLMVDGESMETSVFTGAYFRRPALPASASRVDPAFQDHVKGEWTSFFGSFYAALACPWLNSPHAIALAEDKPRQLSLAYELGFRLPQTLVSNQYKNVHQFGNNIDIVAKPLKSGRMTVEGEERIVFTTRIAALTEADAPSIKVNPVIYQQEVGRTEDLRVTVVDGQVFACRIQQLAREDVDWRRKDPSDLRYEAVTLPLVLQERCVSLVRQLGLRFGAIDLIEDESGEPWFLEINPNGQWAWIERKAALPISAAIVNALTGAAG